METKQFAASSKRDLPEGQKLIVRHCAIAPGAQHGQGGSVGGPVATPVKLNCSECDGQEMYVKTDGIITRRPSFYPSILVQTQGIQRQGAPCAMEAPVEGW